MSTKLYLMSKRFILIVFLTLPSFFRITSLVTAQSVPLRLYQVKTINTRELGMNRPRGMTFVPGEQSFLVWGDMGSVTMTIDGDPGIPVDVADLIDNPLGTAFDQHSDSLFFLTTNATELTKIESEEVGLPKSSRQTVTRFNVGAFDLEDVQGMTFDPHTGRLFILDARKLQILIISPHPTFGFDGENAVRSGGIHRIDLAPFTHAAPRGVAFNPNNGNLYMGSPTEQKIYELTAKGNVISVFDTSPFLLKNLSTMLFAPSSDQTDDLLKESLYLVDSGTLGIDAEENKGRILELSLTGPTALPPGTTKLPGTLVRVVDTSNNAWNPSSPDPSGIDYWPLSGRLLIADSEVDEMPSYFSGDNVFDSTLSGELISTCSTTNPARTGFSNEPSGLGINPINNRIYFSDDNLDRIFEVDLGADGDYCSSDDVVTSVNVFDLYGIRDAEDVAYGQNTIFIAGGIDAEVYQFNLGADGKLGGDDGPMTQFDTRTWGFNDLEGIGYNVDQGTLFIVSSEGTDNYLGHLTTSGTLINAYDLSFMQNFPNIRSDVAFAPGSQNPAVKNIYIVSRGLDNDSHPNENDGKILEISLGTSEPNVVSIMRANVNPTAATSVNFTVTFSETVQGVNAGDFALTTTGVTSVFIANVNGSGTTYTVTVNTGSGNGTVRLDIADNDSIKDAVGNPLGGVGAGNGSYTSGQVYTITKYSFSDVPNSYWAWDYIERLYDTGVTSGCSTSPLMYCPTTTVTRDQMAVFLLRAKHGSSYVPPVPTGVFQDVPTDYWAAAWIEQLAAEGITGGCSVTPKLYCPTTPVTRDQMAVFLLRAKHGSSYVPPVLTGVFQDVPTDYWAAAWIEQLAAEGITGGCSVSPSRYCPTTAVSRDQMAVFLVKTFNLP
jgi:uncharacterized protein YjiK